MFRFHLLKTPDFLASLRDPKDENKTNKKTKQPPNQEPKQNPTSKGKQGPNPMWCADWLVRGSGVLLPWGVTLQLPFTLQPCLWAGHSAPSTKQAVSHVLF